MKSNDVQLFKDRLVMLRRRLRGDVNAMADVALRKGGQNGEASSMPIHMAELGSENYDQEFTLSIMAAEGDTLLRIDAALQRIEQGEYGQCSECGGGIPKARLEAIPYAHLCVRCAGKLETT